MLRLKRRALLRLDVAAALINALGAGDPVQASTRRGRRSNFADVRLNRANESNKITELR